MLLLGGGGYHIQCEFLCPPSRPLLSPFLMALRFPFIPELENRHCHHSRMSAQWGSGPWPKAPQLTLSHTCKLTCAGVAPSQPTFNLMGGHAGILLAPFSILGKPGLHKGCDLARSSQPGQSRAWTVPPGVLPLRAVLGPQCCPTTQHACFSFHLGEGWAGPVLGAGLLRERQSGWVCGCRFRRR